MPGYTTQMLNQVHAKTDMYNRYKYLITQVQDSLLLLQPSVYLVTNPIAMDVPTVPSVIKMQLTWDSRSAGKYVSFSTTLRSDENYIQKLQNIEAMCLHAFQDAHELGDSPYYDLLFGVNWLK